MFERLLRRVSRQALAEVLAELLEERFACLVAKIDDLGQRIRRLPCSERRERNE